MTKSEHNRIQPTASIIRHSIFSPIENYCGTRYAAKLLGLSVGTIQKLVEKNELYGWKTEGGHRRISITSIEEYQRKFEIITNPTKPTDQRLRVLLVEDDAVTRKMLESYCNNAPLPIDCTVMGSGMEALINIASIQPDLLITDLDMPGVDGFELLRLLRQNSQFDQMAVLVLTALTKAEIRDRGELPQGSIYLPKPAKASWFNGFFEGITLMRSPIIK